MELINRNELQNHQKGFEHGYERGVDQGERHLLAKLFCIRFSELHYPTIEKQIEALPAVLLTALEHKLFDFMSAQEVFAWLQRARK